VHSVEATCHCRVKLRRVVAHGCQGQSRGLVFLPFACSNAVLSARMPPSGGIATQAHPNHPAKNRAGRTHNAR